MKRALSLLYGIFAYAMFLTVSTYGMFFVGDLFLTRTIDSGGAVPLSEALFVDVLLMGLFAAQHSVMARRGFKRHLLRLLPPHLERSTFILSACAVLIIQFHFWRPIPMTVWHVGNAIGSTALWGLFWSGWVLFAASTFMIDHFDLAGLKQVFCHYRQVEYRDVPFMTPSLYRHVRHPQYVGVLMAFWATPHMTAGHLLFAVLATLYIRVGIVFEERDLVAAFGDVYRQYQKDVPMLIPSPGKR